MKAEQRKLPGESKYPIVSRVFERGTRHLTLHRRACAQPLSKTPRHAPKTIQIQSFLKGSKCRFDGIGLEARGGIWLVLENLIEDPHDNIAIDAFQ